jgi:hypothetical protein
MALNHGHRNGFDSQIRSHDETRDVIRFLFEAISGFVQEQGVIHPSLLRARRAFARGAGPAAAIASALKNSRARRRRSVSCLPCKVFAHLRSPAS